MTFIESVISLERKDLSQLIRAMLEVFSIFLLQ